MSVELRRIHISAGEAWIMGSPDRWFVDFEALLSELGCIVSASAPEITRSGSCRVVHPMYNVEFPPGSSIVKHPRDTVSRTASGKRRGPNVPSLSWDMNARKGQVMIPGIDEDYIVTYYQKTEFSPTLFDRGVHAVEKG